MLDINPASPYETWGNSWTTAFISVQPWEIYNAKWWVYSWVSTRLRAVYDADWKWIEMCKAINNEQNRDEYVTIPEWWAYLVFESWVMEWNVAELWKESPIQPILDTKVDKVVQKEGWGYFEEIPLEQNKTYIKVTTTQTATSMSNVDFSNPYTTATKNWENLILEVQPWEKYNVKGWIQSGNTTRLRAIYRADWTWISMCNVIECDKHRDEYIVIPEEWAYLIVQSMLWNTDTEKCGWISNVWKLIKWTKWIVDVDVVEEVINASNKTTPQEVEEIATEIVEEKVKDLKVSIPAFMGHPEKYVSEKEAGRGGGTTTQLYALWDEIAAAHPDHITRWEDLWMSAMWDIPMRHYTVKLPEYFLSQQSDRAITWVNSWTRDFDCPSFLLCSWVHWDEKWSAFWLALLIKEMLEKRNDADRANFILANSVLEIIPCLNPYWFENSIHWNGVVSNLNRDYNAAEPQPETAAVKAFLAENHKYIKWLIDMHNGWGKHDYLVAKSTYPEWKFFLTMSARYSNMFFDTHKATIDASVFPYYETWDAKSANGQIHDFATNTYGIPSISMEGRGTTDPTNTKNQACNYLQMFIQRFS